MKAQYPQIHTEEAYQKYQAGYTYLDVRTEEEFDESHPSGAVNIPLKCWSDDYKTLKPNLYFLELVKRQFSKDAPLIVGCKSGKRSEEAAFLLLNAGYTNFFEHLEGFEGKKDPFGHVIQKGWKQSGYPLD